MLRILHSLPRTHKLLLLPVATMVTVLGTQKLLTLYQDYQTPHSPSESVYFPLSENTPSRLPSLYEERAPVANAIDKASRAISLTRHTQSSNDSSSIEMLDLGVINLDVINSADATADDKATQTVATNASETNDPATDSVATSNLTSESLAKSESQTAPEESQRNIEPVLNDAALHIAIVVGTIGQGMLDSVNDPSEHLANLAADNDDEITSEDLVADATSYEDYDIELMDTGSYLDFELAVEKPYVPEWQTYVINPGEVFTVVAQEKLSMGYSEVLALLDDLPDKRIVEQWRAGQSFEYKLDEQGQLLTLKMMQNRRDGILVERGEEHLDVTVIERQGEPVQRLYAGTLSGSFARSAQSTGLGSNLVTEVTQLLEKKYDFRNDSRRGDSFQVLVESDMIDGYAFDSRVLAIRYEGERMDLTLVRNQSDDKFYTAAGGSLDPSFSRYPFEGSYRLSSHFNPRRRHPVTGRVSPHNGTDFAMPIGSSIVAPASGRVERVDYHSAAGRYIVITHDNGYRTRYLHLSRALVNTGDNVEMGDQIALSGNTGRSTGPHLHYEVHVNNAPVNAMKVDLPENTSLDGNALVAFQRQAAPVLAALDSGETGNISVASYSSSEDDEEDE
ncbi:peptidoglycan DD-metalloendopeptidase family protein [Halomonas sp. LS-001]